MREWSGVDQKRAAEGRVERSTSTRMSMDETLEIGEDTGTCVSEDSRVPFEFSVNLNSALFGITKAKFTAEDEERIPSRQGRTRGGRVKQRRRTPYVPAQRQDSSRPPGPYRMVSRP